ncbi:uncharacterized protein PRCAT00004531001 [Priceomyces carsonii]|uniref:uncharacterized protein n=1 Tax=Priceomyces carsonii TaxID=28549 RepID=UPI002ED895F7|nr:unnamed protein product [Priceomyces carsonii]
MATVKEKIQALSPDQRFISFEFFPPKTDSGFRNLLARLNRMLALNPLFITVTWGAGGSTSEKSLDLASSCQKDLGITTVLHLTCTNTNRETIDDALKKAKESGIRNILALRGDPPRNEEYWTPQCEFNNAVDLVKYIKQNYGDYFCIGVAGYPEGHVDGTDNSGQDPMKDIPFLLEKVKAGASFIITQLFYDVEKFAEYEKLLETYPELKDIALIPGLMPITTYNVFTRAAKLSHASIPPSIQKKLSSTNKDDDLVKSIGVEILSDMIDDIDAKVGNYVKGYHFYCLNLEKAVVSIIERSQVLNSVTHSLSSSSGNEEAVGSDSETEMQSPVTKQRRRSSVVNENGPASKLLAAFGGPTASKKNVINKPLLGRKQVLVDISTGRGALGKDATWDDFPNGRFGDSNSPAYGEIDGYGPSLKINSPQEAIAKWGEPNLIKDVIKVFINYLSGKIHLLPWVDSELSAETAIIQEELFELNNKGWFSLASQPAVDGCPSSDKFFGWGPRNGIVYQKPFVELFVPKDDWNNVLKPKLQSYLKDRTITYYLGDSKGKLSSNLPLGPDTQNSKNAVTWGVFPLKEVLLPTIIDVESFKAWNEEAFILWLEWARCYKKDSKPYELLSYIYNNYYLVSLIHHDYKKEHALWDILLS